MELIPRFHQELFVYKTLQKIKEGKKNFLYGWKCRAGKTYGVGHLIDMFYKEFEHINALIITPAPSETLSQFGHEMFDAFINFRGLNIVEIKKGSQLNELRINQNNVYIISKQLLDNYVKSNKKSNFHKQLFDLIICDENHFGGTTHKAEQIFKLFSSSHTHFIFLSATYQKTLLKFNIDKDCQFYWNIEDEHFCKNRQLDKLIYKHDKDVNLFLNNTNIDDKLQFYDNMPELHLLSTLLDSDKFKSIKKNLMDNNDNEQGFSMDVLFSLKENKQELEFKEYVKQLFQYICGTDKHCIYERIKSLSIRNKSRTLLNNEHFTTQLWFLTFGIVLKINKLSKNLNFHKNNNTTDLVSKLFTQIDEMGQTVIFGFFEFINSTFLVITFLALLSIADWKLTVSALIFLSFFYFLIELNLKKRIKKIAVTLYESNLKALSFATEAIKLFKEISLEKQKEFFLGRFYKEINKIYQARNFVRIVPRFSRFLIETVGIGSIIVFILIVYSREKNVDQFLETIILFSLSVYKIFPNLIDTVKHLIKNNYI